MTSWRKVPVKTSIHWHHVTALAICATSAFLMIDFIRWIAGCVGVFL